jgi:hypothetical protein
VTAIGGPPEARKADRQCSQRVALAVLAALVVQAKSATFDDGPGGATCRFYAAAGRLEWQHAGSDWIDSTGNAQGHRAFAEALVVPRPGAQSIVLDLFGLAQLWQRGSVVSGAVLLRGVGAAKGVVNFSAREATDPAVAPNLVLRWDDGITEQLAPVADTFFSCPTQRSLGRDSIMKVGATEAALLEFPFVARPGVHLRQASLTLVSPKQYGHGLTVAAFAPQLPTSLATRREIGLSDSVLRDADLVANADVLYAENFELSSRWQTMLTDPSTQRSLSTVSRDHENGFEPIAGKALRVTIQRGTRQALNHHVKFSDLAGGEPEEAYFRYHLRLGSHWDPVVDGGKLPGLSGTYGVAGWGQRRADGSNGWSTRGAFMRSEEGPNAASKRAIGTYAYTASTGGGLGEVWGWNLGSTGLLEKKRWYALEQFVKLNTPGKEDGVLRVWIDGMLAFEKADVRYRDTPALKIESVWLNVYHGGVSKADRDLTLFIDNLVIARRYIGPGRFPH